MAERRWWGGVTPDGPSSLGHERTLTLVPPPIRRRSPMVGALDSRIAHARRVRRGERA